MTQPWTPEQVVTAELARQLIETQFPELVPVTICEFGEGFDNTVYRVNEKYVFRFPRRDIAVRLIQTESRLLPALVQRLFHILAIPAPLFRGQPTDDYPWPFVGYRLVEGQTPGRLTAEERMQSVVTLANFLRALHAFPVERAIELGAPPVDEMNRLDVASRKPQLIANAQKAVDLGLVDTPQALLCYAVEVQPLVPDATRVLVHGDLHIRNVLVNVTGRLTGIIDWGDAHIGHPALDLTIAYSFLPPEGRWMFFEMYGDVGENTKELARFRAIFSLVVLLLYGHDQGDRDLIASAQNGLQLALQPDEHERPALSLWDHVYLGLFNEWRRIGDYPNNTYEFWYGEYLDELLRHMDDLAKQGDKNIEEIKLHAEKGWQEWAANKERRTLAGQIDAPEEDDAQGAMDGYQFALTAINEWRSRH